LFLLIVAPSVAQQLIFGNPQKMGAAVNSEAEELYPLLSGDGTVLYFSRAFDKQNTGGEFAGLDIWKSVRSKGGSWSPAVNVGPQWNNKESNAVVGVNKDNNSIYLLNSYRNRGGIAFSKMLGGQWIDPEVIPVPGVTKSNFVGYYVNPEFNVILISMNAKDSYGDEDIYVCLKDSTGVWGRPQNLGPTINTSGYDFAPFLSANGERLYFSSNGHAGAGDADIYYSDRQYGSWQTWTVPKNLTKLNSSSFDAFFSIYGDSVAFFSSNREGGRADIYKVKAASLSETSDVDKKYLTPKEVQELVGNVSLDLKFDRRTTTLNTAQNELLFYITNKIITLPDIKVRIVAVEGEAPEILNERMKVIADKLKLQGLGSSRIEVSSSKLTAGGSNPANVIRLMLFR
jgi:hypothetical protein